MNLLVTSGPSLCVDVLSGLCDLCCVPRFMRAPHWSPPHGVRGCLYRAAAAGWAAWPWSLGSWDQWGGHGSWGAMVLLVFLFAFTPMGHIGYKLKVTGVGLRTGGSLEKPLQLCLRVWGWKVVGAWGQARDTRKRSLVPGKTRCAVREVCFWSRAQPAGPSV